MPAGVVNPITTKVLLEPIMSRIPVHDMELGEALYIAARRVLLNRTKVLRNLDLLFGCKILEVLVAEDQDLAFGSE